MGLDRGWQSLERYAHSVIPRILWHYLQSMRNFNLPRVELEKLQLKRLRRALRLAYENVPYYHDLFRGLGKTPSDLSGLHELAKVPLLTKESMIENRARLISTEATARFSRLGSGTSGKATSLAYDTFFLDMTVALQARHLSHFGLRPWKRLVSVRAPKSYWRKEAGGKNMGHPYTWTDELGVIPRLAGVASRFVPLQAAQDDPERDLKELLKLKPDFIMSPPSQLLRMSEFIPRGSGGTGVEGMNLVNEMFTEAAAKRIEEAYGGRAFDSLGSSELGIAAADCYHKRGMHLNEDWLIFEVLRDGAPVGEGEQGELVATVLFNDTMPLIRFATGDTVEMADGGVCECGSSMLRVRRMLGRKADWLKGGDGSLIPPLDVAEEVEAKFGMTEYQIVQTGLGEFTVKTTNPEEDEKTLSHDLGSYLTDRLGARASLSFTLRPREDIWRKNRPVICAMQ